jgi:hypothetical protein
MENGSEAVVWYRPQLRLLLSSLRQDLRALIAVALVLALVGGVAGKLSNKTTSSAQLVLTPLPLRTAVSSMSEDDLAEMIAEPMDIKTAALVCTSDEVLSKTMAELNASGKLATPMKALQTLRDAVGTQVTVARESPMEIVYSPVIQLFAKGKSPAEAKLIVDTWAKQCEELGKVFQQKRHANAARGFKLRADHLRGELDTAEDALEAFRREDSIEYYKESLKTLTLQIADTNKLLSLAEQDYADEQAKYEVLSKAVVGGQPAQKLQLSPSSKFLKMLPGAGALDTATQGSSNLFDLEVINPIYELEMTAGSAAAGYEARRNRLQLELNGFLEQMDALEQQHGRVDRKDRELDREMKLLAKAYEDAALRFKYAEVVSELAQPEIQILSHGAEWRLPRFRRALSLAGSSAVLGFILAALVSIAMRRIILPAFEPEK